MDLFIYLLEILEIYESIIKMFYHKLNEKEQYFLRWYLKRIFYKTCSKKLEEEVGVTIYWRQLSNTCIRSWFWTKHYNNHNKKLLIF